MLYLKNGKKIVILTTFGSFKVGLDLSVLIVEEKSVIKMKVVLFK